MKRYLHNQIGFTLIELILGMVLYSLLGGGIITAISHINRVNDASSARITAVKQVENALFYINRDIQMAQNIETDGEGFWMKMNWTTWDDNDLYEETYIFEDEIITRRESINGDITLQQPLAAHISAVSVTAPNLTTTPPEKAWTIEITATAASGHRQDIETRRMQIVPRPGS
jgi:type II secretory pathway pseudopilin PulG